MVSRAGNDAGYRCVSVLKRTDALQETTPDTSKEQAMGARKNKRNIKTDR